MFAKAMCGFCGFGFVACLFYAASWALTESVPPAAMQAAPTAVKGIIFTLHLGLVLRFGVFVVAAVASAAAPLLAPRESE